MPIEHMVVFCTMSPNVSPHFSFVMIRTFSFFKNSLIEELSLVLPHPAAIISLPVKSKSDDSFNGKQTGLIWSEIWKKFFIYNIFKIFEDV